MARAGRLFAAMALLLGHAAWTVSAQCSQALQQLPTASRLDTVCTKGSGPPARSAACSLRRLCTDPSVSPPIFSRLCSTTKLWTTLCLEDANIVSAIPECATLKSLFATPTDFQNCFKQTALATRSASALASAMAGMCDAMGGGAMAGCPECPTASNCPDPLVALGKGCLDMNMSGCDNSWTPFCRDDAAPNDGNAAAVICLPPGQRMGIQDDSCVTDPSAPSCTTFTYSDTSAVADMAGLCASMPNMPGCSMWSACKAGRINGPACKPFTLLATTCTDMGTMAGCKSYVSLCGPTSVVQQCKAQPAVPKTPSTKQALSSMLAICADHYMSACDTCKSEASCPDPLTSLSSACTAMPYMSACAPYNAWCEAANSWAPSGSASGRRMLIAEAPTWSRQMLASGDPGEGLTYYCPNGDGSGVSGGMPSMLMYFHERFEEIVLWKEWVPRTQGQYVGTIFAVLAFGWTSILLKTFNHCLGASWRYAGLPQQCRCSPDSGATAARAGLAALWPSGTQLWHNAVHALIMGLSIMLDYWNMLIAMTFNVGLFLAVVFGYILGYFCFAHVPEAYAALHSPRRSSAPSNAKAGDCEQVAVTPKSTSSSEQGPEGPACCP